MRGLIHHIIKAKFGWGHQLRKLDIARIKEVTYSSRLFMLYQRDLPYTLHIIYEDPYTITRTNPAFGKHTSASVYEITEQNKTITYRFKSEQECYDELTMITDKKEKLQCILSEISAKYQNKSISSD